MASFVLGVFGGALATLTDKFSVVVLAQVLLITSQRTLLLFVAVALLLLMLGVKEVLASVFAKTDVLSPVVERIILQFVTLPTLALIFVTFSLLLGIVTDLLDTSNIRWNDALVAVLLAFALIFLVVERAKPAEPGIVTKKEDSKEVAK